MTRSNTGAAAVQPLLLQRLAAFQSCWAMSLTPRSLRGSLLPRPAVQADTSVQTSCHSGRRLYLVAQQSSRHIHHRSCQLWRAQLNGKPPLQAAD